MEPRKKPGPKASITGDVVRTSVTIRRGLWLTARRRALSQGTNLAVIVNDALVAYLKGGAK